MVPPAHSSRCVGESAFLAQPLQRLDRLIAHALAEAEVPEVIGRFARGGKRLRARLVFASAADNPLLGVSHVAIRSAAAIELVHAASLVHDDIVDQCASRRGEPTIVHAFGPRAAAASGQQLVHVALALVAELPLALRERIAQAGVKLSRGQFLEMARAGDPRVTLDERLRIMALKTAAVFGLACEAGGLASADAPARCTTRRRLGRAFGMLFQIADDLDDVLADAGELGRATGADVVSGVVSLPICAGLMTSQRAEFADLLQQQGFGPSHLLAARAATLLRESGALRHCAELAQSYASSARTQLATLPSSGGTAWMVDLIDRTLERVTRWLSHDAALASVSSRTAISKHADASEV